jgi:thioredoxin-related protein/tetratricopeptide (TPR) repeat protein
MKRVFSWLAVVATLVVAGCQPDTSKTWFDGDLETALAAANARDTQVMIEFYADWCNWCRRLEADTFSVPEVRSELQALVSMKMDAEKEGAELADRFEVDSYPTLIFLDSKGNEMDRILGYLPPEGFLRRVQRIRTGDTFLACLRQLEEDPGNIDAIERSVSGLLERSDPEGAISRIEAFHQATEGEELDLCRRLMFASRAELHGRVYQRAAKLYRRGWDRGFEVPDTAGTAKLHGLVSEGLSSLPADEQADLLRDARFEDAGDLLEIPNLESASADDLLDVAGFAFSNGHFDRAAELYIRWYKTEKESAAPGNLNDIAWRLYLAGTELETAIEIAQTSFAVKADPETADTLARLLYVTGSVEEAIALEQRAAEEAEGPRSENYVGVASRMQAGESLDDRPTFKSYPGKRRRAL